MTCYYRVYGYDYEYQHNNNYYEHYPYHSHSPYHFAVRSLLPSYLYYHYHLQAIAQLLLPHLWFSGDAFLARGSPSGLALTNGLTRKADDRATIRRGPRTFASGESWLVFQIGIAPDLMSSRDVEGALDPAFHDHGHPLPLPPSPSTPPSSESSIIESPLSLS